MGVDKRATSWENFRYDPVGYAEGLYIRETCEDQRGGTVSGLGSFYEEKKEGNRQITGWEEHAR